MAKLYHYDFKTKTKTVTDYGHDAKKMLADANNNSSSSKSSTDAALEAEKAKLLKQARFNANVNSLMRAGFTRTEAEDLAAQYFDDTTVSIGKILSNAPKNSTVKLSDGRVTTVSNAAKMASSTQTVQSQPSTKKLEAAIDKLAAEYAAQGKNEKRFLQKVAEYIRTYDSKTQNYLLKYSKKAAGAYGELRETSATLVEFADAHTMIPAGVLYSVKNPSTIIASEKQHFSFQI